MNIKALITTLGILGSSSLAMAHPVTVTASAGASWSYGASRPVVRDHRYAPVPVQPVRFRHEQVDQWGYSGGNGESDCGSPQPRGQLLASGLMFNSGEKRKDIVLEGRGRFSTVQLDAEGGNTFIKEVRIEFIGGAVQSIPVNRYLSGTQSLTFDLDGHTRAINRLFIYRADGNSMDVSRPSRGEFSVTAR